MDIINAENEQQIQACYPVLKQLRPHIQNSDFVERIQGQMQNGYRLLCLVEHGQVLAVAGYRIGENLAWGRHLYVDDLVTDQDSRSQGAGRTLLEALHRIARSDMCQQLHLDSGVQRFDAHRFYLREGMSIVSHHLAIEIN